MAAIYRRPREVAARAVISISICLYVCSSALLNGEIGGSDERRLLPLAINDAIGITGFVPGEECVSVSPDGALVAYGVTNSSRGGRVIEINTVSGNLFYRIESPKGGNWAPAWSPDGAQLAFLSDRDGRLRVWIWDRSSHDARALVEVQQGWQAPLWMPDGKAILATLPAEVAEISTKHVVADSASSIGPDNIKADLTLYRSPYPAVDETAESKKTKIPVQYFTDLGLVDIATGQRKKIVKGVAASWVQLSNNGRQLAYLEVADRVGRTNILNLVAVDLSSLAVSRIASGIVQYRSGNRASWSPDGRRIAFLSLSDSWDREQAAAVDDKTPIWLEDFHAGEGGNLFVASVDEKDGAHKFNGASAGELLVRDGCLLWNAESTHLILLGGGRLWKAELGSGSCEAIPSLTRVRDIVRNPGSRTYWSAEDNRCAYVLCDDDQNESQSFVKVDLASYESQWLLNGSQQHITDLGGGGSAVGRPGAEQIWYQAESAQESRDIWMAAGNSWTPRRFSNVNRQFDKYKFGSAKLIAFIGLDGRTLRGTLLLPADYQAGSRYPLVVWVYPGMRGSAYVDRFGLWSADTRQFNLQILATRGYAVLCPDIPVHPGRIMTDIAGAVLPAIDKAIDLGIVDPERVAVMGQSKGGYATLALLVQTTRFKAAVMNAGYGDLVGMYGAMDLSAGGIGVWQNLLDYGSSAMGAPPWKMPHRYVENSPVFYLDRIETPLLMQAGSQDAAIVPFSDQVFIMLKRLQKDVTYLRYDGEAHSITRQGNLKDFWARVLVFLESKIGTPQSGKTRDN